MLIARQSTARTVMVGPVLDADGVAVTDGVVGDFKISKNGGAPAALNGSATLTHRNTGHYSLALTASDLDTVGQAEVVIDDTTNACPVKVITVVEEAVYDALFAASAVGPLLASADGSTLTAINLPNQTMDIVGNITGNLSGSVGSVTGAVGSVTGNVGGSVASIATGGISEASYATTAGSFAPLGIVDQGTAQSATGTTLVLRSAAAFADDQLIGATIVITGGSAGVGQSRTITDYVSSTDTATVEAWTTTPTGTITYKIFATAPSTGGSGGGDATEAKQDTIIALIGTPAVDLATDIGTRASQSSVDTIDDLLDTEIGAITSELAKVPKSDSNVTWNATALASINAEADAAIETYHLDHLLAATYDPASKPGAADALLNELVESDGGVARFTANALEQGPSGSGPSAADIADAVWEEALGDHSATSGSTAEALAAAGGAGDPWITPLPGSYSAGQAGYIVGTNLNATVSSRASQSSLDDVPTNAELATALDPLPTAAENATAVWGSGTRSLTVLDEDSTTLDLDATIRAAVGLGSANLDTQIGDLPTNSELSTALGSADDAVLAAIAALNNLSSAQAQTAAAAALTAYDPPTRAELTSDTNSVLSAIGDVPTNAELATALDPLPTAAENAAAVLAATVEGSVTVVQSIRLANAVLGGKASGLETTEATYRDLGDTKDRIVATVDSDGNRTAVTRDLT